MARLPYFSIFITVGALVLVAYNTDLSRLVAILQGISAPFWPLILSLTLLSWFLSCWRLHVLFPKNQHVTLRDCSLALGIGAIGNLLLPLRSGDVLRCAVLNRIAPDAQLGGIVTTLALEKFMEAIAASVILIAWASVLVLPDFADVAVSRMITISVLAAVAALVVWVLRDRIAAALSRTAGTVHWRGRLAGRTLSLLNEAGRYLGWRRLAFACCQTALIRFVDAATFLFLALAVGIPLTLPDTFLVIGIIAIATAIPAAPGFVGIYEAAGVIALSLLGFNKDEALAYILVSHGWFVCVWIVAGLVAVAYLPGSLRSLTNRPVALTPPGLGGNDTVLPANDRNETLS